MDNPPHKSGRSALLFALALGVVLGVVGMWNTTICESPPTASINPLGVARQELLDALSGSFTLERVEEKTNLYVVKMGNSTATVAIQGTADSPNKANVTAAYSTETAPVIATAANLLANTILGDAEWYGSWAGEAIHKCEPGFDIVGTDRTDSGIVEVRISKLEMNGAPVLSVAFRRLK